MHFGNSQEANQIKLILFFDFPLNSFLCFAVDHALENFYSISLHSCAALGMVHENGGIYILCGSDT